jgi:hypothetical protein
MQQAAIEQGIPVVAAFILLIVPVVIRRAPKDPVREASENPPQLRSRIHLGIAPDHRQAATRVIGENPGRNSHLPQITRAFHTPTTTFNTRQNRKEQRR